MKAVIYRAFGERPVIEQLPDPVPRPDAVVLKVMASGVCLSDWHGWQGNDPDIELPHVPGHELAGVVEAIGSDVTQWRIGDRVTVPFVGGCGRCPECLSGNHQVCDQQFQPGFTHWGSFAEYVAIHYADVNLVRLPDDMGFETAASLGCRFATSFRAIVDQGRVVAGQWVAVHGCGGVGLSAVMIATGLGAKVLAVDLSEEKLELARELGAAATLNARSTPDVAGAIRGLSNGGVHVSVDAIGNADVCFQSINSLRKRGRHIQVGLMVEQHSEPKVPMGNVLSNELEILGSHGMQAHRYGEMLGMISAGTLSPGKLIGRTISLEESIDALTSMSDFSTRGVTLINQF
ncbi:MAG: alcohol dehydrogenase catalytic domain-containing protein [Gammaproteobacteria bacterium]|nr:alcohol dehydrogenase catalytic domain-containing protein [Gammaproteobacteria bacterium]